MEMFQRLFSPNRAPRPNVMEREALDEVKKQIIEAVQRNDRVAIEVHWAWPDGEPCIWQGEVDGVDDTGGIWVRYLAATADNPQQPEPNCAYPFPYEGTDVFDARIRTIRSMSHTRQVEAPAARGRKGPPAAVVPIPAGVAAPQPAPVPVPVIASLHAPAVRPQQAPAPDNQDVVRVIAVTGLAKESELEDYRQFFTTRPSLDADSWKWLVCADVVALARVEFNFNARSMWDELVRYAKCAHLGEPKRLDDADFRALTAYGALFAQLMDLVVESAIALRDGSDYSYRVAVNMLATVLNAVKHMSDLMHEPPTHANYRSRVLTNVPILSRYEDANKAVAARALAPAGGFYGDQGRGGGRGGGRNRSRSPGKGGRGRDSQ